jgi:hypothetical protein
MTRQPAGADPDAGRNRAEVRSIWQVARAGSGRAAKPRQWAPQTRARENIMPISDPGGIAPEKGAGDDRATVFVGWPRIFPGV